MICDQLQICGGDLLGQLKTRGVPLQLAQLQQHAFAHAAGGNASGVQALHQRQHGLNLVHVGEHFRGQRGSNGVQVVGEIAIVVHGINDRLTDDRCAGIEVL